MLQNIHAWDRLAREGHVLATPVTDEELRDPMKVIDEIGWLGKSIRGWRVLCLAAGGGRHGPLYCAAGSMVTVVDLSPEMLKLDRQVAFERKMDIRLIESDMCNLRSLQDGEFDLVVHPVSTCYVSQVPEVFQEVARVLRIGGLYISQHKQPINLQASLLPVAGKYVIERPAKTGGIADPSVQASRLREPGTREVIHSLQTILGGICRAGFVIEDFAEPQHGKIEQHPGTFGHRCAFQPPYIRIKTRRVSKGYSPSQNDSTDVSKLWIGS